MRTIRPINVVIMSMSVISNNVFPWRLALRLKNGQKKTVEVPRQTQNLVPSEESATASTVESEQDISQWTSKKTLKRDSWSNSLEALINA